MTPNDVDPTYLEKRLDAICDGLKEGVRREVRRLRRLGLPVYVADNGKVVSRTVDPVAPDDSASITP
ncbi:MAG: hypothetical protein ACE5FA_07880 [Dehalococcoidia bacterium]